MRNKLSCGQIEYSSLPGIGLKSILAACESKNIFYTIKLQNYPLCDIGATPFAATVHLHYGLCTANDLSKGYITWGDRNSKLCQFCSCLARLNRLIYKWCSGILKYYHSWIKEYRVLSLDWCKLNQTSWCQCRSPFLLNWSRFYLSLRLKEHQGQ